MSSAINISVLLNAVNYYFLFNALRRANVGIFCSTPGIPLVRNVPRKSAMYMLFTGFPISGKEAYECGLVSKVVANNELGESSTKNIIETSLEKLNKKIVNLF